MVAVGGQPDLPAFQQEVARMFFAVPASEGFLLAGGAALLAQHLTTRPTADLDFFTAPERGRVPAARDALEAEARRRGWTTERFHDSETFCRMVVRSADAGVLVDPAVNAPPDLPASVTSAGPTLAPEELAGHKLLALFDRAAARDFADVYVLARLLGKDVLLARAAQIDAGFVRGSLAAPLAEGGGSVLTCGHRRARRGNRGHRHPETGQSREAVGHATGTLPSQVSNNNEKEAELIA
jgi:Nucleotidyl transferase AbiEii toxin, Type IV TA system